MSIRPGTERDQPQLRAMKIAFLSAAMLVLIQVMLGLWISRLRWKYRCSSGSPEDPCNPLSQARVAMSNCAEWHPALFVVLLIMPMVGAPAWTIWLSPLAVCGRCILLAGLLTKPIKRTNSLRFTGAALTYLICLIGSIVIIANTFSSLTTVVTSH